MSTSPEADFDLEKLFLPAWAQESPSVNRYAKYSGDDRPERKFDDRPGGRRPPRRDGPRRDGGGGGRGPNRGQGGGGPQHRDQGNRPHRDRAGGGGRGNFRRDDRGGHRQREEHREPPAPLPEIAVTLMPDEKGVDSLSRQIKMSGRSFPLFDIAHMILQKPERQQVRFEVKKRPDGQVIQPLFLCAIDDTLWLSEEEAVDHALGKHFGMFYQAEKKPTDPPKGTYTFVAQCGMSGIILGPPNYHDYQNQLRKLHAERFSRMPFDMFKSRVKIVKEEAVVKKWIEDQSFKTEYICLNVAEASRLGSREEVEKHFREVHLPNIIKPVEKHVMSGPASRQIRSPGLQRLVRAAWDEQKRFPLQIATILSQQFASHGLQFFKVNKTITHVSVARPHYLDMQATPVSDQVKRIVEFIDATPKCTRRQVVEHLAPTPAATPVEPAASATSGAPAAPPAEAEPTPEQASIIGDLHWLIHQGHVIEFANGVLETAKKPAVKPPKPPKPQPEAAPAAEGAVSGAEPTNGEAATTGNPTADAAPAEISPAPTAEAAIAPEPTPPSNAPEQAPAPEPVAEPPPEPAAT